MDKIKEIVLDHLRAGDDMTDIADKLSVALNDAMKQYRAEENARKNSRAKDAAAVEVAAAMNKFMALYKDEFGFDKMPTLTGADIKSAIDEFIGLIKAGDDSIVGVMENFLGK